MPNSVALLPQKQLSAYRFHEQLVSTFHLTDHDHLCNKNVQTNP